jgi:RHS repeat-associated protein
VAGGATTSYTYDALGNLVSVQLPGGPRIDYLIDGRNRRVGRKVDGVLEHAWLYQNGLNPVAELDGTGAEQWRYVYGTRAQVPELAMHGDTAYRVVSDQLGSVRALVRASDGLVTWWRDYDAWGNVLATGGGNGPSLGFAGGLTDAATGLVRFGARDYDPSVGRWTAKDPIGFAGGKGVSTRTREAIPLTDRIQVGFSVPLRIQMAFLQDGGRTSRRGTRTVNDSAIRLNRRGTSIFTRADQGSAVGEVGTTGTIPKGPTSTLNPETNFAVRLPHVRVPHGGCEFPGRFHCRSLLFRPADSPDRESCSRLRGR